MLSRRCGFRKTIVFIPQTGIPTTTARCSMPPFTPKEVARYFVWVGIIGVALGAILWMLFHAPGRKQIQMQPGTASDFIAAQHVSGEP
jgi:hypothetical protein